MIDKKKTQLVTYLLLSICVLIPQTLVNAQSLFDSIDPLGGQTLPCVVNNITTFIGNLGIALVVVFIIIGSLQYMTSGGDQGKIKKGHDTLLWSAIGLGVILLAQGLVYATLEVLGGDASAPDCSQQQLIPPGVPGIQLPPAA